MNHRLLRFWLVLWALLIVQIPGIVWAGEVYSEDAANSFTVPVMSMKELRELRIVHQAYDFSCGSAAVATLLTFSYDRPTTEREAFDTMWAVGDQEHIKKYGFSLLDMQKYLASLGLHAAGYKLTLEKLRQLHVPAIALISPNGYNHFVVVRGWRNGAAIVADPMLGLRRMPEEDFAAVWNGVVFLLKDQTAVGESHYNDAADFKLLPRSISGDGMLYGRETMNDFLINIPLYNDY